MPSRGIGKVFFEPSCMQKGHADNPSEKKEAVPKSSCRLTLGRGPFNERRTVFYPLGDCVRARSLS